MEIINQDLGCTLASSEFLSLSLLSSDSYQKHINCEEVIKKEILSGKQDVLNNIDSSMHQDLETLESNLRYGYIDEILEKSNYKDW